MGFVTRELPSGGAVYITSAEIFLKPGDVARMSDAEIVAAVRQGQTDFEGIGPYMPSGELDGLTIDKAREGVASGKGQGPTRR